MGANTVDARDVTLSTLEETNGKKLRTSSRKRASTTLKGKDSLIQTMKNCNLAMSTMTGTKPRKNSPV